MRNHFNALGEEHDMKRLHMLRLEVATQGLANSPCPLLKRQLNELEVLTCKLLDAIHKMQSHAEHHSWC
jgi:hypothetical protein